MSVIINVNELIMNGAKSIVYSAIMEISRVYNFDGEEACRMLELESVNKVKQVNSVKPVAKSKALKSLFALPFNGFQDDSCCQGLRQSHGLYTQCQSGRMNGGEFCKSCQSQCDKNGHGVPDYGTIGERMKAHSEGVEFKDPSGKSPTAYSIVMKKLKLSREQVEEEAGKLNIIINDIHFEEEKVEKKEKGRPKKPKRRIELADDSTDLFAALVAKANEDSSESGSSSEDEKLSIAENIIDSVLDKVSVIAENKEKEAIKQSEKQK